MTRMSMDTGAPDAAYRHEEEEKIMRALRAAPAGAARSGQLEPEARAETHRQFQRHADLDRALTFYATAAGWAFGSPTAADIEWEAGVAPADGPTRALIADLESQIKRSRDNGEEPDDASWGYEAGVLLSRAEAEIAL